MAKEIERKFLVLDERWRETARNHTSMRQAYIASMEDRSLRVRILDGISAKLTIKIGRSAMTRDEFEYDIPLDDAEEMLGNAIGIVLDKTRHEVAHEGYVWEVDVYHGAYNGLVVAEVELDSEHQNPPLPDWLGPEVTGDSRYSNQSLATEDLRGEMGLPLPTAS